MLLIYLLIKMCSWARLYLCLKASRIQGLFNRNTSVLCSRANIKSVRGSYLQLLVLVEDPDTEEIRFEVNSEIKDLEDHQMLALLKKGNGKASSHVKNTVYQEALDLTQQLTTMDSENASKPPPQTKESLLKSHMNENAQEYA